MAGRMPHRSRLTPLVLVLVIATGLSVALLANASDSEPGGSHPLYAFDPRNDVKLAAAATDIFVGRVVARVSDEGRQTSVPEYEIAQTQFAVEVIQVVKGTAAGTVVVNQLDRRHEDRPLRPGEESLFVTEFEPEYGWHSIIFDRFGHLSIAGPADRVALVARFAQAAAAPPVDVHPSTPAP